MKKFLTIFLSMIVLGVSVFAFCGCSDETGGSREDTKSTISVSSKLQEVQPTPTDINYSLERYNLIRRAYWVNGQRDRANTLECPVEKPLGYIALISGNSTVAKFVVDGKVSSLNSFLTPDSEYYEAYNSGLHNNRWIADVDGSYGANDDGIFFFTPDGKYIEWSGDYLYSDIPFDISDPIVTVKEK